MFFCSSRKYKFPGRNGYEWSWTIPNILEYLRIITINYGWYGPVTVCYGLLRIGMKQNVFKTYFHNYVFEGSWKTENSKLDPRLFSVVWWTLQACMMTHRFKLHYDGCILLRSFFISAPNTALQREKNRNWICSISGLRTNESSK